METTEHLFPWLNFIERPAFCVKDGVVVASNAAAQSRMLRVGTDIYDIVTEHREDYQDFNNGCLFLTVTVGGLLCNASINRTDGYDIFILEQEYDAEQLQVLTLAAQQLRIPLSNVMAVSDRLFSDLPSADEQAQQQAGQLRRGLYQLLRIISNMSDSANYHQTASRSSEMTNLTALYHEIIEKAQAISESAGIQLVYSEPKTPVLGLANTEKLERAVYNILSNAIKFSPTGSTVEATLTANSNHLSFTVCNICAEPVQQDTFWNRYRRQPGLEESRYGLGLGMTLISAVATAHGGTVLIDHPDPQTTRVTMTITIVKDNGNTVHSPIIRISDYAGCRDKALLEFSDFLPTDAYHNI